MRSLVRRCSLAIERHGAKAFPRLVARNVVHYINQLVSGQFLNTPSKSEFDTTYGLDTEAVREVGSLDVATAKNARYAVRYQPSPSDEAAKIVRGLDLEPRNFTFIDYGAGKGRVLLIAAELPFQRVIGVEFSAELCEIARRNIARIPADRVAADQIECVHADVTTFTPPNTPLLCYFYNPFDRAIMTIVAGELLSSLRNNPRETFIIYLHPEHRAIFDESTDWRVKEEGDNHVVYQFRLPDRKEPRL